MPIEPSCGPDRGIAITGAGIATVELIAAQPTSLCQIFAASLPSKGNEALSSNGSADHNRRPIRMA